MGERQLTEPLVCLEPNWKVQKLRTESRWAVVTGKIKTKKVGIDTGEYSIFF